MGIGGDRWREREGREAVLAADIGRHCQAAIDGGV